MLIHDMAERVNIFWFRRDLRLQDNAGLYHALNSGRPVLPIFIFDSEILEKLENKDDRRVQFIHTALQHMQEQLLPLSSTLRVLVGKPVDVFKKLLGDYEIESVFINDDYEPYAITRDKAISELLVKQGIEFLSFKDHVVFEKSEITKDDGKPYTVFTPYSRKWRAALTDKALEPYATGKYFGNFAKHEPSLLPTMADIGFNEIGGPFPGMELEESLISHYGDTRNFPGVNGTSRLGVHFRFGTLSIRSAAAKALQLSPVYLSELIWRDFYQMILWQYPQVGEGKAFKPAYDKIEWRKDEGEFKKWCDGQTGYPIVDAGMRELNTTGFMHNRVRMIVASFLCKHLLLDWRLGEAYFAEKLLDFDLASNNGGWQWAAGSGCDAAPYFRIFNPYLQTKKFDPDLVYIKKWVPEFQEFEYPKPIVNHEMARNRCLAVYAKALKEK